MKREEQRWHDGECDESEPPVDLGRHVQHSADGQERADDRDRARDHERLDRLGVVLDPVGRIGHPRRVVVAERQSLEVAEEAGAKAEQQLLACMGAQDQAAVLGDLLQQDD